jgi:predicted DNA-binding transcriptional regulator AlpA
MDEVKRMLERWPVRMPAAPAMRILGLSRNTFYARVKEGCVRYAQDGPRARKVYMTEDVRRMAGL